MGADGYDAGSIFVTLKAQLDEFNVGILSAKKTLDTLGDSGEVVFEELNTGTIVFQEIEDQSVKTASALDRMTSRVERMGLGVQQANRFLQALNDSADRLESSFSGDRGGLPAAAEQTDRLSRSANNSATSFARYTNRIIQVQIALLNLSQSASGPMKEAFQAISNGVSTAGAAFSLAQGKVGLLGAGLIGLGVAIESFLFRRWEESIKATDAASDQMDKSRKSVDALKNAMADASTTAKVFGATYADQLSQKLSLTEAQFTANQKRIREISDELRNLNGSDAEVGSRRESLNNERDNLNKQQDTILSTAGRDKAIADVVRMKQETKDLSTQLDNVKFSGEQALRFGLAEPLEVASGNAREAKAYFDKLIEDNLKIQDDANRYNVTLEQRKEILSKLHTFDELDKAAKDAREKKDEEDRIRAVNDLAKTFSTSVGDALRDAILNAKKPMEALAAVGQNLFGNMVDQFVKRLETGLESAFKAISGAAGEGIGLAVTGILGAAGAVLSKLGSKGTDAFNPVQSAVTSTQAVRGIVAGPSSVAIATVGDNLQRAMGPVVAQLQAAVGYLSKIEVNTRGGRASGGGGPAVAVATR